MGHSGWKAPYNGCLSQSDGQFGSQLLKSGDYTCNPTVTSEIRILQELYCAEIPT